MTTQEEYQSILEKQLFFITGRGRSGTWLLQTILDTHPEICVAPEALFVIHLYRKYRKVNNWTSAKKQAFVRDLLLEKKMADWWQTKPESALQLLEKYPIETDFSSLCKAIYYEYANRQNKATAHLLGDKNPEYSLHIPTLARLFPEARFIHIARDPRANVLSYQKVSFDVSNVAALAYRWKLYNQDIQALQEEFPNRIFVLKYENLLTNTEATLKEVCVFLQIEFTPELLNFYKSARNVFPWNKKIAEPIDPEKAADWKGNISPKDEAAIFSICGELARDFGYTTDLKSNLSPTYIPGLWLGRLTGFLEKLLFRLPLSWRMFVLNIYRRWVKVLEK